MRRLRNPTTPPFRDRRDAGQRVAEALAPIVANVPRDQLIILGLARGGVVVAAEVATTLQAKLDAVVVRKVGAPRQPELAIGAVGPGDQRLFNRRLIASIDLTTQDVTAIADAASRERDRLDHEIRGGRPAPEMAGRTVVLVDDGLATGASMRVTVEFARTSTDAVVVAVPVAPPDVVSDIEALGARVVCLVADKQFGAVGSFYERFDEVRSDEVRTILNQYYRPE